jgi:hypothetical protein
MEGASEVSFQTFAVGSDPFLNIRLPCPCKDEQLERGLSLYTGAA